jgi:hypothetical protein
MGTVLILAITAFYLTEILIIVRFSRKQQAFYLKSAVTASVLLAVFLALHLLLRLKIPDYSIILVLIAVWIHHFLGYSVGLYGRTKMFDRLIHLYGAFSFALFFYFIVSNISRGNPSRLFAALFVVAWGIALGAIFEVGEYIIDQKNHTDTQKGLKDTDFDLVFDVLGSLAAGLAAYFFIL